ncbi:MAG: cysteine--tRNA ligase [Ignavibacteriales bacterium]|nr:cysteine--tRNA ligase [Ignavibacteriales bacterium]
MALLIYNSLTRKKEEFKPIHDGLVNMYVCGPTVYGLSHFGHAKSYVSFDIVVRYLRYLGYKVTYVQNITDVGHLTDDADQGEDKIAKQARTDKLHPMQVVEMYTREYFADMDSLDILRPDISPRATGHLPEQIEMVQDLLKKGFAYEVNGSVYFDVTKDKEYGKLSGRVLEEAESGTRVEIKSEKRNPADFALWKKAEPNHIMQWNSPWGKGFPGWHLECSAMSMKYLGETFDIHGGGMDNQFPHHECEIAQSECSTGKPFVKYWMHNNLVTVNGQKMGKSLGNFVTLKDAYEKYYPLVIRFFILQSHYRSTLDYSEQAVEGAAKGLEKLRGTITRLRNELTKQRTGKKEFITSFEVYKQRFFAAMDDDFNAPQAIGVLFELVRELNDLLNDAANVSHNFLMTVNDFLTIVTENILGLSSGQTKAAGISSEPQLMELLITLRNDARKSKNFAISDKIRDDLKAAGIVLEDGKDGTTWKRT